MKRAPKILALVLLMAVPAIGRADDFQFVHPGLLQCREDLARMKAAVAAKEEPIFSGYEVFRKHPQSQASYVMKGPFEVVGRGAGWTGPSVTNMYDVDASAAYQCAIMWCITGEKAYAEESKQILNAWSGKLRTIGGRDAVLGAGLGPFKMINAAEIIRYSNAGWSEGDIQQAEKCFKQVVYPVIEDFAPFANGNWDTAAIKTVLAIGVFCNDRAIFERGLRYYVHGAGNGRLTYYIINDAGECQETGRDAGHSQLGLAHLGDASEVAWNQGLDLYAYADNRLLKGFEYTAAHNGGTAMPFVEWMDRTGDSHYTRASAPGPYRMIYEEIYNHYVNRRGLAAPYTQKAAERIRPEIEGVPGNPNGADHMGFGTLLFTRPKAAAPFPAPLGTAAPPAAVIAESAAAGIRLTWIQSIGATAYTVKRAAVPAGAYAVIARDLKSATFHRHDHTTRQAVFLCCHGNQRQGGKPGSVATTLCAGLPAPWTQQDVGNAIPPGYTQFDGRTFTLEAGGAAIGGTADSMHVAAVPLAGDGTITARYVPQVSSQHVQFGLLFRESGAANAPQVAFLIQRQGGNVDNGRWDIALLSRPAASSRTTQVAAQDLAAPTVTEGRLLSPFWLRLTRAGDTFTAAMSIDGQQWAAIGTATVPLKRDLLAGLAAASHLVTPTVWATSSVTFDHVSITGWKSPDEQSAVPK